MIVLSDDLYQEILAHPIPNDLEAVKLLGGARAVLDPYMWFSYQCFKRKARNPSRYSASLGLSINSAVPSKAAPAGFGRCATNGSLPYARSGQIALQPSLPTAHLVTSTQALLSDRSRNNEFPQVCGARHGVRWKWMGDAVTITLEIPDELAARLGDRAAATSRESLGLAALKSGLWTEAQLGRFLGLTRIELDQVLKENGVEIPNTCSDLERERALFDQFTNR